jgi:hypothetical protein
LRRIGNGVSNWISSLFNPRKKYDSLQMNIFNKKNYIKNEMLLQEDPRLEAIPKLQTLPGIHGSSTPSSISEHGNPQKQMS